MSAYNSGAGKTAPAIVVAALLACAAMTIPLRAAPIVGKESPLPQGTELNDEGIEQPTERFHFEAAGGKRSYLFNLGDMLFSSSAIYGEVARNAGTSCNTCHQGGAGNAKLYIPGLSSRPGTFDATGALFNPKADNGVLDAVTPPSLRGAKYLAPYGHDGRFASLRDFIRNVVVVEFGGPEPSGEMLDALFTYVSEIAFLPNGKLQAGGRLGPGASEQARRGERVFKRPFPHDAAMSCAACHQPGGAFVDHRQHDVGTGGFFKTPTLLNANLNAPYFHDGRFDSYGQVVAYFDAHFDLGLSGDERADLVAYLDTIGNADESTTPVTVRSSLDEIAAFASVLDTAIPAHNAQVVDLTVESVGKEWRELGERFPPDKDPAVSGGHAERRAARLAARNMVLALRRVAMASESGDFGAAAEIWADYKRQAVEAGALMAAAEPWSFFNARNRQRHLDAVAQLTALAK